jgi:hypothetical protein
MKLVKKILAKLNGLHYPPEYLCFPKESFSQPLRAYLVTGRQVIKDITGYHSFTGYSPLVFTIWSLQDSGLSRLSAITIILSNRCHCQAHAQKNT